MIYKLLNSFISTHKCVYSCIILRYCISNSLLFLSCSLGPLHGDKKYSVEASKTGYVLTKDSQNPNNFKALQLGEISVTVR